MRQTKIKVILAPLNKFIEQDYSAGLTLLVATIIALIWANSPWKESYHHLWETELGITVAEFSIIKSLHIWVNDGLMSVFFFMVGLELKREFMAGELSSLKKATLPAFAAIGGMIVPATIYTLINLKSGAPQGWGIPMATDIAFSLGVLAALGKSIPIPLKVFLIAFATVDDLGAVVVIALFYTSEFSLENFLLGVGFASMLLAGNLLDIRTPYFYAVIGGIGVWTAFLLSGIHATIAGVISAFMIPANTLVDEKEYSEKVKKLSEEFEKEIPLKASLVTHRQNTIIEKIKMLSEDAQTPLQKLEYSLSPIVLYFIMPVFALSNAGVEINSTFFNELFSPVGMGIFFGLLVGKFIGIVSFAKLTIKMKWAELPAKTSWKHIYGVALLGGIGFTMSLFISELAFKGSHYNQTAKIGIFVASLVSGGLGYFVLKSLIKKSEKQITQ
ncbi:MAG TPA: Na+/H+ antiporter NhaA [Cytophagaceae bacterium]